MEEDDWANALAIHDLECKNEELENELFYTQDELAQAKDKICDLQEQEAIRDETKIRRGW
ncbi:MAG: hypothetical protein J6K25_15995 [Thermoguttaceae bacterium]|nr:hypothetical protein [Thermoguttaceae bacterium]MBP3532657.1 hypothetical protein [Thermoguttaceae bacterium]